MRVRTFRSLDGRSLTVETPNVCAYHRDDASRLATEIARN
jgi:hypothetical protein